MFKFLCVFSLLFSFYLTSFAKNEVVGHPLFSTPNGYVADYAHIRSEFDGYKLDSYIDCPENPCANHAQRGLDKKGFLSIEGKVNETRYSTIDGTEVAKLLILKNYQNAVQQLGGKAVSVLKPSGTNLFIIEKDNLKTWVLLFFNSRSSYSLAIIESAEMRKILNAGQLSDQISKQGFVNLNVNFDTNKSVIKDDDNAAINEVVTLLKNDTKLKLSVEGHTDNVGAAAANKSLSQARSDSLVAYMVAAGISAGRLVAKGFGSEAPVADNRTEEGKAKNRRVELVKIK